MAEMIDAWAESTVADEFYVQLGKRLDAAVNRGELRPCINNRAVRWGRVVVSESVLAPLTKVDIRDLRLVIGDVLVCEGGEIGRASVWSGELPEAYFLNTLHRLRSKGRYEPRLLVAFFERWAATGEFSALVGKSSIAHLTKENLVRIHIPVPPPAEQKHLVETLRAVDQLVESVERLIVKKQAIKQGMMQQLLTGRARLPSYRSDWIPRRLESVLDKLQAGVSVNSVSDPGPCSVLKTSCVSRGEFYPSERKTVASSDIRRVKVSPCADSLIISRMNTPALVGEVGYVDADYPTFFLPDRLWLATKRNAHLVDMRWLAYTLSSAQYREQLREIATGTSGSMKNISRGAFLKLSLSFPPIEEQTAIASVLKDTDDEIIALRTRLDKAVAIKQGMMQQLLTGRTRLLVQGTAA